MIIVSDTSPISNLLKIHRIELLHAIYDIIVIPPAVNKELIALKEKNADIGFIETETWVKTIKPEKILDAHKIKPPLHVGEIEAISLAKELHAAWLLIDEKAGRNFAKQNGVRTIGLIGVLIEAKRGKHINEVMPIVDDLINVGGFWISDTFYQDIKQLINE
jgi:predicted nucleic acid-binding protein